MTNNRRYRRLAFRLQNLPFNTECKGCLTSLSEKGCFVETSVQMEKGSAVGIRFLEGGLIYGAIVRRITPQGFGAEFEKLTDEHREEICEILKKGEREIVIHEINHPTALVVDDGCILTPVIVDLLQKEGFTVSLKKPENIFVDDRVSVAITEYIVNDTNMIPIVAEIKKLHGKDVLVIIYTNRQDVSRKEIDALGLVYAYKSTKNASTLVSEIKESVERKK
jgi:hypothetical protein